MSILLIVPAAPGRGQGEHMLATMLERGNGFAQAGDFAPGDDGELYLIVSVGPRIETGTLGEGNRVEGCEVELSDWDACTEDDVAPVLLVLEEDR